MNRDALFKKMIALSDQEKLSIFYYLFGVAQALDDVGKVDVGWFFQTIEESVEETKVEE